MLNEMDGPSRGVTPRQMRLPFNVVPITTATLLDVRRKVFAEVTHAPSAVNRDRHFQAWIKLTHAIEYVQRSQKG